MTRALIVDDNEENVYYLQSLLKGYGFTVETAHDGADALTKAREVPPDIVISDLLMPVMDGFTLLNHWKADAHLKQVPFVVYTATYTEPEDEELARSLGADGFILKPTEPDVFVTRLREVQAKATRAILTPAGIPVTDETAMLKLYNETLVRKLEAKMIQLEEKNHEMEQDIAHRKLAEETLRQSEERFHRLLQDVESVAVQSYGPDGTTQYWNRASEELYGYTAEEAIGRNLLDLIIPPEMREDVKGAVEQMASTGHAVPASELTLRRKDGSQVTVFSTHAIVQLPGRELELFCIDIDLSERKRSEDERAGLLSELESERARLADIFTHAPAFIASLRGPDHIFELANARYYDLIGQRDLIGRKLRDAFPEGEGQGFFELLDDVYGTGVPFVGDEMPVEIASAPDEPRKLHYINFVYQPLKDVTGAVSGIICHGVDVTEQVLSRRRLKETEDQLRQSQKLESVGMLAGGIAHDFNNLLTVITGYSDLTLRGLDNTETAARNIKEVRKAAEKAAALTRQLLAFSRKQVLQPKVLDLNDVIGNVEKMLGRLIGEDMELCAFPAFGLGRVKADRGQIEQVILNLVVNARDAMPDGGKITIETANVCLDDDYASRHVGAKPGWHAMLAIGDTGHGIDADTQASIFEPFFTTKEQGKGTGLGLSTVYGIVKQSGGSIWVYSEIGVGTTFKIYLPIVDEQVTVPEAETARQTIIAGTETILLAEDDEMVRNLACESLKMHGYTVLEAADAGAALSICRYHEGPIHLLLTDVVMPRTNGKKLANQVLKLRPEIRILYMSGYTDQTITRHGILDEGIAFLGKPFTPDALALKVAEELHRNLRPLELVGALTTRGIIPDGTKRNG